MTDLPFDGPVLVQAGGLASIPPEQLPALLTRVQADLSPRIDGYRREYERVLTELDRELFLVPSSHWDRLSERFGLSDRERDAVVRAHETQLERLGSVHDRRAEFESALEIRSAVVVGVVGD